MDERNEDDKPAPVGRVLAGDFDSPLAVLAADELSEQEKRDVLMTWRRDLERQNKTEEHGELIATIDDALKRLG